MRSKSLMLILFMSVLLSCATENELLVNPPPRYETVKMRFYNLSSDGLARTLSIESSGSISNIASGAVSAQLQPSADSVLLEVLNGSTSEYKTDIRFKFGRNVSYTFIGLPTPNNAPNYRPLDTLIAFGTSISISQNQNEAYIKMFNANPDSTVSYSMNLGCPNGTSLASYLYYRKVSLMQVVRSGEVPLSIIKKRGDQDSLVGLFAFNFAQRGQYTIIIKSNSIGAEEILLLDDLNGSTNPLSAPTMINERFSEVRTLNFSSEPISLNKVPGDEITNGLIPYFAEKYTKISACESLYKDTLEVHIGSDLSAKTNTSFAVLEKYTVAVFDSAQKKGAKIIIADPVSLTVDQGNKAVIRVINGNYLQNGISVSIGARAVPNAKGEDAERGFRAGDPLASRQLFGTISGATLVEPGILPIAVFTSTEPAKLITTARLNIEAGKQYLLVMYSKESGEQLVSLIEDSKENSLIENEPAGVFVQAIHGTAGKDFVSVNFPGLFSNAKLNYTGSLATIVEAGTTQVQIDGITHTINATPQDRVLLISSGTKDEQEIFDITSPPLLSGSNHYIRRYINASKDTPKLNVKSNDSLVIMGDIPYKTRSSFEKMYQEKKFSLYFENAESGEDLVRIDDLLLTYLKTFSIIFVGNKNLGGYSVIIQQEY